MQTWQLRRRGAIVLALAMVVALCWAPRPADAATSFASAEEAFVTKINAERRAEGLGALVVDTQLVRVARAWTDVMAAQDKLYHNPKLGAQVEGDWRRLGENVGYTVRTGASHSQLVDRLHTAFMDSPGHRRNVLGDYNQLGVGVSVTSSGKMWVTVNFASATLPSTTGQIDEAVKISRSVFADAGQSGRKAQHVVLGRADVFADSLSGAGLAGDLGPILLTPGPRDVDPAPVLHPRTRAEIDRILGGSGTVYLLGGTSAVSSRVSSELQAGGYTVRRLAGANRVETSVKVAHETVRVRGATGEVMLATSRDWADAVSGGAYAAASGTPVVLTDSSKLSPEVAGLLRELRPQRVWALGGTAALSAGVLSASGAQRVSGPDRFATAVAIAERLWGRTGPGTGHGYLAVHGRKADGWAYALVNAPRAAVHETPQLLVDDALPAAIQQYLGSLGYTSAQAPQVEGSSDVPQPVIQHMRALTSG